MHCVSLFPFLSPLQCPLLVLQSSVPQGPDLWIRRQVALRTRKSPLGGGSAHPEPVSFPSHQSTHTRLVLVPRSPTFAKNSPGSAWSPHVNPTVLCTGTQCRAWPPPPPEFRVRAHHPGGVLGNCRDLCFSWGHLEGRAREQLGAHRATSPRCEEARGWEEGSVSSNPQAGGVTRDQSSGSGAGKLPHKGPQSQPSLAHWRVCKPPTPTAEP